MYNTQVPEYFEACRDLVREWADEVVCEVGSFDDCAGAETQDVHEIENKSRDGFIPFTSGGFEASIPAYMGYAYGSGFVPKAIEPYLSQSLKDCQQEWDEQNPQHTVEWIFQKVDQPVIRDMFGAAVYTERDHWRDKYGEFETGWMNEGSTYFYKVRALFHNGDSITRSESGDPEVLFCVAINTDFEYGRDNIPWLRCYGQDPQQSHWLWEKTVKAKDVTPEMIQQFTEEAVDALRQA